MAARIDDHDLIRRDYAQPNRLALRFRPFREYHRGVNLDAELLSLVSRCSPDDVLEIGCGHGHFSALLAARLPARVQSIDQSESMVALARKRGVDASVGDAQALPFDDDSFDVVVANWMLYHLPDLDVGLREISRVLKPGGTLVAATMGAGMLQEVWDLVPDDGSTPALSFSAEDGAHHLLAHFADVRRINLTGSAEFPDYDAVIEYIGATLTRAHLARHVPYFDGPLHATTTNVAFVARTRQHCGHARAA